MIKKKGSFYYDWNELSMTTHVMIKIFVLFGGLSIVFVGFIQAMTLYYVILNTGKVKTILDEHAVDSMDKTMNSTLIYVGVYFSTMFNLVER